jgi:hypothetical protein
MAQSKHLGASGLASESWETRAAEPLTGSLVHLFSECGVMKAAVNAEIKAAAK